MRCKIIGNLFLLIWGAGCFSLLINVNVFAQSDPDEKPTIKQFGKSLRKFGKEDKNEAQDTETDGAENQEIIRVKTNLVVSDVLVADQKGNIILGLQKSDFLVTENNIAQEVELFSFGESAVIPRSIVLIIDYSGSQLLYIENSIKAAKVLVDKLAPQDRMAIVTDDVKLLVDFTKDKVLLKKELDNLREKSFKNRFGRSEQYSALVATLKEKFDEEDIRPIVIFQTDGDELLSLKGAEKFPSRFYDPRYGGIAQKKFSFEDICAVVDKSRATIYSIIPGYRTTELSQEEQLTEMEAKLNEQARVIESKLGLNHKQEKIDKNALIRQANWYLREELALTEIAKLSAGYTDYIEKPEDAENVYSNIFKVIINRYVIGYYPKDDEKAGKRRNVRIEVKGHPEYTVIGRKSYYASTEEKKN